LSDVQMDTVQLPTSHSDGVKELEAFGVLGESSEHEAAKAPINLYLVRQTPMISTLTYVVII